MPSECRCKILDDRALAFDGNTKGLASRIKTHKPWYEEGRTHAKIPSSPSRG